MRSAAVVNYPSSLDDFNGAIANPEGGIDSGPEVTKIFQDIDKNLFCHIFIVF